jgi:hypothetical protein
LCLFQTTKLKKMNLILNAVRLLTFLMIGLTIQYMHLLTNIESGSNHPNEICRTTTKEMALWLLFIMLMILMRMFFMVCTRGYNEIDWGGNIFSDNYNIIHSFYIIQVILGALGWLSARSMWTYFTIDCFEGNLLYEFVAFGFISFLLVSLPNYCKCCIVIGIAIATIVAPVQMFLQLDRYFARRPGKIFVGDKPECCVCYDANCWVIACGHLICRECVPQIKSQECPLCRSRIYLIEPFVAL